MRFKKNITIIPLIVFFISLTFEIYKIKSISDINYTNIKFEKPIPTQKIVDNVYVVMVDGLRYDSTLPNMPYISSLVKTKKASIIKAKIKGPSNSRPGYARIFTGAPTSINKIENNSQTNPCKISSVFETVRESGLSTGASAYFWVGQLFNKNFVKDKYYYDQKENIQHTYFYSDENQKDSIIFDMGMLMIDKYNPTLCLIHPMEVDMAGHNHGGKSSQYKQTIKNTDEFIKKLIKKIDLKKSILMVISDHGHTDEGYHGGDSPEETEVPIIFIGTSVKGGVYNQAAACEDIAPTICVLLGVPFTPYMSGSVIDFPFNIKTKYLMDKNHKPYKLTN